MKKLSPDAVLNHYGYQTRCHDAAIGFWENDGTVVERFAKLSSLLNRQTNKKKVKITFDYDPNFPYALVQTWGLY